MRERRFLVLFMAVVILSVCAGMVYAAGQSSANYAVDIDVISGGGGNGGSTNYDISDTTGQSSAIRDSSSSSYYNFAGFWNALSGTVDSDGDGIPDYRDNCEKLPNSDQRDTNSGEDDNTSKDGEQHYGNICDPDFNNDGAVNLIDFNTFRDDYGQTVPPASEHTDLNGDGAVNLIDFNIFRLYYSKAPGTGIGD